MEKQKSKSLILPKGETPKEKKKLKGIYIYCNTCKLHVKDTCGLTGKKLKTCATPESQSYKAFVVKPGTNNKRAYKILESRDLDTAIAEKEVFRAELINNNFEKPKPVEELPAPEEKKELVEAKREQEEGTKPVLLITCMAKYVAFLKDEGVYVFQQKKRSKDYVVEVKRYLDYAVAGMAKADYDTGIIEVGTVSNQMVAAIHTHFKETLKYKETTYNKAMSILKTFFEHLIEKKQYPIRNPINQIEYYKVITGESESISEQEFTKLMSILGPENGIAEYKTGLKKNVYHDFLSDGFELALETGTRREELVMLSWPDVIEDANGELVMIRFENMKVNRINNRREEMEKKYTRIIMTPSLKALLYRLGYLKYRGTDNYILAPESPRERATIMNDLTRGFTHYWKQIYPKSKKTLKHLRKSWSTNMEELLGEKAYLATGHSSMDTLDKHYSNKDVLTIAASKIALRAN